MTSSIYETIHDSILATIINSSTTAQPQPLHVAYVLTSSLHHIVLLVLVLVLAVLVLVATTSAYCCVLYAA